MEIPKFEVNATHIEAKEVDSDDWENESDSNTASGANDQDSEVEWSNSTYEEYGEDDAYPIKESGFNCQTLDDHLG
jgi:hypothetical protein